MIILTLLVLLLTLVAFSVHVILKTLTPQVPIVGKTNVPGVTSGITWPLVGDAFRFVGVNSPTDLWNRVRELSKMRERAVTLRLGRRMGIFIKDAKMLEMLLISPKCLMKDDFIYEPFNLFTAGLFAKNGKEWSDFRKPLTKLMHPTSIEKYTNVFATKTAELCEILDGMCDKGVIDVHDFVKYCAVDIVLETIMGVPGTQMKKNTLNFPNLMHRAMYIIFQLTIRIEYRIDWIFNLFGPGKHVKAIRDELGATSTHILEHRRKDYAKKGVSPYDPDFEPENYSDAVIQLINNGKLPTTDRKYHALFDLIIAGYDTTSITVSSACLFLAMHPDYQEKLYSEQVDVMGDSLEPPTQEQLSKMSYLTMVYHETLRHVGVPGFARVVNSEIEVEGFVFPVGASLFFSVNALFNDPKYWEKPSEFYPDHFLPEFTVKRPKGAFLPFSSGPRSCPGKAFANSSVKIMLSMLFRRFRFTSPLKYHELTFDYAIMVESTQGYPVEMTRRT